MIKHIFSHIALKHPVTLLYLLYTYISVLNATAQIMRIKNNYKQLSKLTKLAIKLYYKAHNLHITDIIYAENGMQGDWIQQREISFKWTNDNHNGNNIKMLINFN
jgi:hypothetical protein